MKIDKVKISLVIPIVAYVVFIFTLYSYITIASTAFFIMVMSTIIVTILAFRQKEKEDGSKENQRA